MCPIPLEVQRWRAEPAPALMATVFSRGEKDHTQGISGQGSYNDRRWTWMLWWMTEVEGNGCRWPSWSLRDRWGGTSRMKRQSSREREKETEELAHRPWGRTQKIQQVEGADSQAVTRPMFLKLKGAQVVECGFWSRWIESYQSFNQGSYKVWCLLSKDQFGLYVENESYKTKSRVSVIPLSWRELTTDVIA